MRQCRHRLDDALIEAMKTLIRALAIGAVTVLIGCETISATHDFNPAINFDQYRTFAWISAHPLVDPAPNVNPLLEGRIEQTARDLLTAKGYRFVDEPERADFVVGFGLGATDKVRIDAYPAAYRGAWHWNAGHDVTVRQHTEGRLVVDIFDVRTHQPAWHGWSAKTLTVVDRKDPQPAIRSALAAIFANFPPS
jgi:hypothetical protein